ncbi:MAG: peptide chain release factor N(5)-glutamine methyltransferase [Campylobacteraceae bacterium]|jgi:release factor glutamine methyltransferase|nr:peptide chain release factor N(5)-glutamine methyltransferase [Campylobacteraceae bacterium]
MPTIKEVLQKSSSMLSRSVINPKKEAMILLREWIKKDEVFLITHDDFEVSDVDGFFEWVKRRAEHTPLEYITQKVSFCSKEFVVEEDVLVPRPETEILVDKTLNLIKEYNAVRVAEIGTGSGVISIMLALLSPQIKIDATDISSKAIEIASINARKFGVEDRIKFHLTSYLDGVESPQILVSNPPYISKKEELEKHVLNEPHNALFGGEQGDEILKEIVLLAKKLNILALACEMGYDQKHSLENFFKNNEIKNYLFYQDLSGFDRGFIIKG